MLKRSRCYYVESHCLTLLFPSAAGLGVRRAASADLTAAGALATRFRKLMADRNCWLDHPRTIEAYCAQNLGPAGWITSCYGCWADLDEHNHQGDKRELVHSFPNVSTC